MVIMQNAKHAKWFVANVLAAILTLTLFMLVGSKAIGADPPEISTREHSQTLLLVKSTPAGAEIRLNGKKVGLSGELLSVKPGTYKLVVDMTGHEPIEQQITIRDGRITRIELTLDKAASRSTTARFAGRTTLKHDDDKPDGKRSLGGNGEMIRFTLPEGKWKLKGIQLHGSRYGYPQPPDEDFQVYILDKQFLEVATEDVPYRLFQRGNPQWVSIRFKEPVEVPEEFWVCVNFNAEQTKGVYVSYDTSTGGEHSKIGLPGGKTKNVDFGGDWMIRIDLAPADESDAVAPASRAALRRDDGKSDGQRSIAGGAEMVRFTLPEGDWKVKGIQLFGSRYGYPQPPAEDFQIHFFDEDLANVVVTEEAPYRLFRRGDPRWVRIQFKKPVEVPKEFWVGVQFNAQPTKGVYVHYDTSTGGKFSKVGSPEGTNHDVDFGGDWMIRVDLAASGKTKP